MRNVNAFWRNAFDIREGERLRTLFMASYLFLVLFAHYILKPISRSTFVTTFGSGELPYLYVLIAVAGGLLATVYTKFALRTSLRTAVTAAMVLSAVMLILFSWLLRYEWRWLIYAFNLFQQLFGVVLVAQGWLVAANIFTTREAKRVYGLVGLGGIAGGWMGAVFTAAAVGWLGNYRLLFIGSLFVVAAYAAFRLAIRHSGVKLSRTKASEEEQDSFSTGDMLKAIGRHRHLQVIAAIMVIAYIVDQLVEFQLQVAGDRVYGSDPVAYTRFLGLYNLAQNTLTLILQFLVTGVVVSRLGVGGTLKLMPTSLAVASLGSLFWPGVLSAAITRLTEAASRYSVNKAAMELLYLPLPMELRNRTKAFVDVFGDRLGRGLAGVLLIVLAKFGFKSLTGLPLLVIGFTVVWMLLTIRAQKEYILTIRKRLEARRLDLESARVTVGDPALVLLLEQTARSSNARQATYALSVLAEAPGYDLSPVLQELVASPLASVRSKVYELARSTRFPGLVDAALAEIRSEGQPHAVGATPAAVPYVLTLSPDAVPLAREFLDRPDSSVAESTLLALSGQSESLGELVSHEWLSQGAMDPDPERRRLAAVAVGVLGDEGTEVLHRLLSDSDSRVVVAAFRAVGKLKNRAYVPAVMWRLADPRLRGEAIEALAGCGVRICGTLGDMLEDDDTPPAIRRQIPRVLRRVPDQRAVDTLLRSINQPDLSIRGAVLKALNGLRETAGELEFGPAFVTRQILSEAQYYFALNSSLAPLRDEASPRTARRLLVRSIEERLKQTLERLFRLLGLRYPPREIYAAYLAVHHGKRENYAAALEFLDNVLDRDLKRVLLPLLDDSGRLLETGRNLFGLEVKSTEDALRGLLGSGDAWLLSCAMAAAAELRLQALAPDIDKAARGAGAEVGAVARSAKAALA